MERSSAEKDPGVLENTKMNMSKQHTLAAGKYHQQVQKCDSVPLLSTGEAAAGVLSSGQLSTKETCMYLEFQWRATKMVKGLKYKLP